MRWTYDLCGAEPIIKDCPVYDSTELVNGEMLMKGATVNGGSDGFVSLITAYTGTAGNQGVDNVGILNELTYDETTTPSATFTHNTGVYFGKVIINPFAVYRAEYGQLAADDVAVESSSTTTSIYETIATADEAIGGYIYFTHTSGTTAANRGCLRMVTGNTTASATIAALPATPTATTDQYIMIQPAHCYLLGGLDATATKLSSPGSTMTHAMSNATGTNYRIVNSWMEAPGIGFVPLNGYKDRDTNLTLGALDNLPSDTKFYSDFIAKDHIFGAQE